MVGMVHTELTCVLGKVLVTVLWQLDGIVINMTSCFHEQDLSL